MNIVRRSALWLIFVAVVWFLCRRQGGDTLTAPDDRDGGTRWSEYLEDLAWGLGTDEQHDAKAERWYERHYPSGVSDPVGTVTYGLEGCTGCGAYAGSHQLLDPNPFCDCRCHETTENVA
jgi:hypothetical protein